MADITYIDKFINDGIVAKMNLRKFDTTTLIRDISKASHITRVPIGDMFLNYRQQFEEAIVLYQIPRDYFYRPKSLSLELYGTTELWLSLLRLNNMKSIVDFKQQIIKVYDPYTLNELLEIFMKREAKL